MYYTRCVITGNEHQKLERKGREEVENQRKRGWKKKMKEGEKKERGERKKNRGRRRKLRKEE